MNAEYPSRLQVLLVEDDPGDARLLAEDLRDAHLANADLNHVQSLSEAEKELARLDFDAVLLDLSLPDSRGIETIQRMSAYTADIPIVVLTGLNDEDVGVMAVQAGAQDYLVKGEASGDVVLRALRYAIERSTMLRSLRESEERYELAVRGANDGIWDWRLDLDRIHYSPRWAELLGYSEDELTTDPAEWLDRVYPEDLNRLETALINHLNGSSPHFECEYRLATSGGTYRWMRVRGLAMRDNRGIPYRIAGSQTDVTQHKKYEDDLRDAAYRDELTGLYNRAMFQDRLGHAIARHRRGDHGIAVLFLDLDNFKVINDSLGHEMGDRLLMIVADRLRKALRVSDTIARFGGDEFTILLEQVSSPDDARIAAERIIAEMEDPVELAGRRYILTMSIGIATSFAGEDGADDLMQAADVAMYRIKGTGKAGYAMFEPSMMMQAVERMELEHDLRDAIEDDKLKLAFQPVADLETAEVIAVEALARWEHPRYGSIAPGTFIPIAEETALIAPLGRWCIREACIQARKWHEHRPDLRISVNVSAQELRSPTFASEVFDIIDETGIDPGTLTLEVTESTVMTGLDVAVPMLRKLRERGVRIAVDDFGTGYSSLAALHDLPIDTLKIDRSFVIGMDENTSQREIVRTITVLARTLGLDTVAEGVETEGQLRSLQSLQCRFGQGFLFSRPVSAPEVDEFLIRSRTPSTDGYSELAALAVERQLSQHE